MPPEPKPIIASPIIASKGQLNRVGEGLCGEAPESEAFSEAYTDLNHYRRTFSHPMMVVNKRCRKLIEKQLPHLKPDDFIIAQRLKRLDAIIQKLNRKTVTKLATMQDLGGLRVIVPSLSDVYRFVENFPGKRSKIGVTRGYDYIRNPKPDGYRGIHLICELENKLTEVYSAPLVPVELQVRTELQHCWATAVEMIGLINKRSYKTGEWDEDWKEFLQLASECFEAWEGKTKVAFEKATLEKLKKLTTELDANHQLAVQAYHFKKLDKFISPSQIKKHPFLILERNDDKKVTSLHPFSNEDDAKNTLKTLEIKYQTASKGSGEVVLINLKTAQQFKKAYPNYVMDISRFLMFINQFIAL